MDIKSASYLKNHSDELLDFVNKTRKTIIITQNDEAKAVIQDYSTYEKFQQAFLLLKFISRGEKDYREGKVIPHLKVKKQLEDKLVKLQKENA
ncbi:MAG: type II toxin-antitoxin system Phd/YefM family antitoxin [bacterium]|nr:MAG: type II toxin-antitoxin system Phd/YefM family antitoxin [bacterium]